jgi:asparagine synthase (glutamine-hydrolysing)
MERSSNASLPSGGSVDVLLHTAALPGFLAGLGLPVPEPADFLTVSRDAFGAIDFWRWGLEPLPGKDLALIVSRVVRDTNGSVPAARVVSLLQSDPSALARLLPPFGAVSAIGRQVRMVADSMGFQHLFYSPPDAKQAQLLSSSSLVAGRAIAAKLDETAVAVQSLLGWQLGQRTLLAGIQKLAPAAIATLDKDGVKIAQPEPAEREPIEFGEAVLQAAALLRTSLNALLDDHPEAVLQLTGGMDSRLLLSAIPERRRRGLRAMTLEVPGTGDVAIAGAIARLYGVRHNVHGLTDVGGIDPEEAWKLCLADTVRLDAMADPVALAAQRIAELAFDQGVRISGLGGEIARGFYYVGKVHDRPYTRADAEQLAAWRMFVNEAVEPGLLTKEFSTWARRAANEQVYEALVAGGEEWFRAADELYVRHRMQRWAGATDTAVSDQRMVVNPMLDAGFLDIAARLSPQDKAGSRFLAALQMELDPELGRLPLEGRPAPAVYANPPRWQPALNGLSLGKRVARKAMQKLKRGNRPPAGGTVLAGKVVQFWRGQPRTLEPLAAVGFVRDEWLDDLLSERIEPRPSSVAFVTNIVVAASCRAS